MTVASILSDKGRAVVSVAPEAGVRNVVEKLFTHRIGAVLVMQDDAVVGLISERDIVRRLHTEGPGVLDRLAHAVMVSPVITIGPDWSIAAAMEMMTVRRVRHLPVLAGGRLLGVVSIGDLVKFRIEEAEREAQALKEYIRSA